MLCVMCRELIKLIKWSGIECTKRQQTFLFLRRFIVKKCIYKMQAFYGQNLILQLVENILSLWQDESHSGMVCFRMVFI